MAIPAWQTAAMERIALASCELNRAAAHPICIAWQEPAAGAIHIAGLMEWDIFQLEILIGHADDKDLLDYCQLSAYFGEWNRDPERTETPESETDIPLPLDDPGLLYNLLTDVQTLHNCKLGIAPVDGEIMIGSVSTEIPVVAVTAQTLLDAILRVTASADLTLRRLLRNAGREWWKEANE